MAQEKKDNIHKGHREKVRKGFYENGFRGMPDHNILEMLLFFGIPYRDTNTIAHELINRFGSFSAVMEARRTDLMQVKGMTENAACLITMVLPLYKKYVEDLKGRRPKFSNIKETVEFLRALYIDNSNVEKVYALCFDANGYMITHRIIGEGDIGSSSLDMRRLAALLLETNASSVIISHNHPHGVTSPSIDDIKTTKTLKMYLDILKVRFTDHIIVSDDNYFSMLNSYKFAHIFYNIDMPEDS